MSPGESTSLLRFRRALTALKQEGSAILVVGEVPRGAHQALCDRMLGHGDGEYRRVSVDTDAGCTAGVGSDVGDRRVFEYTAGTRSASAAAIADGQRTGSRPRALDALADDLHDGVHEAAAEIDDRSRLRLCIDSLLPLVSDHGPECVFRLLHPLCTELRSLGGTAHCHLPIEHDAELVRLYRPLFDAVIRLRVHDGIIQHRWKLVDRDVESEWLNVTHA